MHRPAALPLRARISQIEVSCLVTHEFVDVAICYSPSLFSVGIPIQVLRAAVFHAHPKKSFCLLQYRAHADTALLAGLHRAREFPAHMRDVGRLRRARLAI